MTHFPPQPPQGPWQPQHPSPGYGYPLQPPPPGYGYPPPPPGYGYPPPNSGGPGKWLIIGGLALAVVVALVAAVVVGTGAGNGGTTDSATGPGASTDSRTGDGSDEAAIRQLFADIGASSITDVPTLVEEFFCASDQRLLEHAGDMIDVPGDPDTPSSGPMTISDIEVDGNEASARVTGGTRISEMYFRKESGVWKICMSAMPGMPSFPN